LARMRPCTDSLIEDKVRHPLNIPAKMKVTTTLLIDVSNEKSEARSRKDFSEIIFKEQRKI